MASMRCVRPILTILSHALAFASRSLCSRVEGGDQLVLRSARAAGDVHRGGERVVGRLAHVDVVVGVDGARCVALGADADGRGDGCAEVGDHLVGVHVGRGAGAGLVDVDGEVIVVFAGGHFLGEAEMIDVGEFLVELAEFVIRLSAGGLQIAERVDDGGRHGFERDGKVVDGACVDAPYSALAGTCISPIVSRSVREDMRRLRIRLMIWD